MKLDIKFSSFMAILASTVVYVTRFAKRVLYMLSFKTHISSPFNSYMDINAPQCMCVILPKVEQSAFTQASFPSHSDVHEY